VDAAWEIHAIASLPRALGALGVGILNAADARAGGGAAVAQGARQAVKLPAKVYHYTRSSVAPLIERYGLLSRTGSIYTTPDPNLSPLQAQIDLALPPNRGLPDALFEIDLAGLVAEGVQVTGPWLVGRWYNMPGGGIEVLIHATRLEPRFLRRIR
jgi:hypothetical protein